MKQYLDLVKTILETGVVKESGRAGMPDTKGIFSYQMRFNLKDGFPLLTTKKMPFKLIAHELIWFLRGDTNIKYLLDNGCNIWNQDAYRHYKNLCQKYNAEPVDIDSFIDSVKQGCGSTQFHYNFGDLGDVYGAQWRHWRNMEIAEEGIKANLGFSTPDKYENRPIDQIKKVIDGIKKNPYGRRHIVSAWNPAEVDNMALPPCHLLFQFNCRPIDNLGRFYMIGGFPERDQVMQDLKLPEKQKEISEKLDKLNAPKFYLDCDLTQRSCDTMLGIPFNIASYALLTEVVAKMCGMVAGEFIWCGKDVHIYQNHFDAIKEQLSREPMELCTLNVSDRVRSFNDIAQLTIDDLSIEFYESHPAIKAELSVGI